MEVEDLLMHYASPYYDPIKAREYYLRTRELKGRTSGSDLGSSSQRKSEATSYVRDRIATSKKAEETSLVNTNNQSLINLQKRATETRDRILKLFQEQLDKITADAKAKVPELKLNVIPENASDTQKAFLRRANQRLTNTHNKKVAEIKSERAKASKEATTKAKGEINKIATDLKAAVQKVRDDYTANRQALNAKYQATLTREMDSLNRNFS